MSSPRYEDYWTEAEPSPLSDPLTSRRSEFLWGRVASVKAKRLQLLDCGAGHGALVAEARARGLKATGLEVSAAAIARAEESHAGVDLRKHSVEDLPWPIEPSSWDVVVSFEVIEHLLEPRAWWGRTFGARPGRRALHQHPVSRPREEHGGRSVPIRVSFAVDGDHIRFFTDRALRRLLETNGFEVLEIAHLGALAALGQHHILVEEKVTAARPTQRARLSRRNDEERGVEPPEVPRIGRAVRRGLRRGLTERRPHAGDRTLGRRDGGRVRLERPLPEEEAVVLENLPFRHDSSSFSTPTRSSRHRGRTR